MKKFLLLIVVLLFSISGYSQDAPALTDTNDTKPLSFWENEYAQKKEDPSVLKAYIEKRSNLGLSNAFVFDKYLQLLPESERTSETVVNLYVKEMRFLRVNSFAFDNLIKYKSEFEKTIGAVNFLIFTAIKNTVDDAALLKDENLLHAAMSAYDQLPQAALPMQKDELYRTYYQQAGDKEQYIKYTISYVNNSLMKISDDSISQKDKENAKLIENMFKSESLSNTNSEITAKWKEQSSHMERDKIGNQLDYVAREFFDQVTDKKALKNALKWAERSLDLTPDNVQYLDTYANLLYKLGKKKAAIEKETLALSKVAKEDVARYRIEDTIFKMKDGKKTWKE